MPEPECRYVITPHAAFEMQRRRVPEAAVRSVLASPDQRYPVRAGRDVLQSKFRLRGKTYLVRVFVDVDRAPAEVVTIYLTSQVAILEREIVKASYDARTDTLSVIFRADVQIAESDEDKPGIILDYDKDGNLVSLEILDASQRVTEARRIEFETVG
jgi:uncharacterized protein YuzE